MPDGAAREVAADGDPHDHRAREGAVAPPADRRSFRAELLHGGPDVVEELDLRTRAQPAKRLADRAPDDARLGKGGVEAPRLPELALQTHRDPEHAALPGHGVDRRGVGIRDVFSE